MAAEVEELLAREKAAAEAEAERARQAIAAKEAELLRLQRQRVKEVGGWWQSWGPVGAGRAVGGCACGGGLRQGGLLSRLLQGLRRGLRRATDTAAGAALPG
jgi:hypothetical protein